MCQTSLLLALEASIRIADPHGHFDSIGAPVTCKALNPTLVSVCNKSQSSALPAVVVLYLSIVPDGQLQLVLTRCNEPSRWLQCKVIFIIYVHTAIRGRSDKCLTGFLCTALLA